MNHLVCIIADKQFPRRGAGGQGRRAAARVSHAEWEAMPVSTLPKMLQYQRIAAMAHDFRS